MGITLLNNYSILNIFIFVYLVGLSTIYTYFEEKKDEIKLLTIPTFILFLVFDGFRNSGVGGDLNFYVNVFRENSLIKEMLILILEEQLQKLSNSNESFSILEIKYK